MPIIKSKNKLIFYSHVPKCGGSSVYEYLRARFGAVGFYDQFYMSEPFESRWTRTSPQHIDIKSLEKIMPTELFDETFAVVRNPFERIVSAFLFQKERELSINADKDFSEWLSELDPSFPNGKYDNHLLPMHMLVHETATVFRLEDGLDRLIPWLDQVTEEADGPRSMLQWNSRDSRERNNKSLITLTSNDQELIKVLYREDFERFGYDQDTRYKYTKTLSSSVTRQEGPLSRRNSTASLGQRTKRRLRIKVEKWVRKFL